MFIYKGKRINSIPTRRQLEQLTIDDLVELAKLRRSIKCPFKKALVDYILTLGEWK
jgi:uncharacterized protein YnzC (UPF0291/DUF896 family)